MTNPDFNAPILEMLKWKQIVCNRRPHFSWSLPNKGASTAQIDSAEKIVGFRFSNEYRDFLRVADGWKSFGILGDLLGTADFQSKRHEQFLQRQELHDFVESLGVGLSEIAIVGATENDLDVFLLISPAANIFAGNVIWFASEEVDHFHGFAEYFSSMVLYCQRLAMKD